MKPVSVKVTFQPLLLKAIDDVARRESRSRSELIRKAARMYIERRQKWDDVFAFGEKKAHSKKLSPSDVADEISAYRKSK